MKIFPALSHEISRLKSVDVPPAETAQSHPPVLLTFAIKISREPTVVNVVLPKVISPSKYPV
jgi:hypothetical protein